MNEVFNFPDIKDLYNKYSYDAPVVLLTCFSPKEAYTKKESNSQSNVFYDENDNVLSVASLICSMLNEKGINTMLLCEETNSSLSDYAKDYKDSVNKVLLNNPSITYFFDISRGLEINDDLTINRENVTINGEKCPTIQLWCGTCKNEPSDNQKKGIFLAKSLAEFINSRTPFLISKQTITKYDLYRGIASPVIRIDVGAFSNTYEEALTASKYLTEHLAEFLTKNQQ